MKSILRTLRSSRHAAIAAAVAFTMTTATAAFAQDQDKRATWETMTEQERLEKMEDKLDRRMARLTTRLALSEAQAKEVRAILAGAQAERMEVRERHAQNRRAAKPELRALKERAELDLAKVLSSEQLVTLGQMQERREKKKGRMKQLKRELDLSDDQVKAIKALRKDRRLKAKALIDAAGSRQAARPELKELRQSSRLKVRDLLTSAQQQKFDELHKARKKHRTTTQHRAQ